MGERWRKERESADLRQQNPQRREQEDALRRVGSKCTICYPNKVTRDFGATRFKTCRTLLKSDLKDGWEYANFRSKTKLGAEGTYGTTTIQVEKGHITIIKSFLRDAPQDARLKELAISRIIFKKQFVEGGSKYVANILGIKDRPPRNEQITMEMCLGQELNDLLSKRKSPRSRATIDDILFLFGQIVLGVGWLHKHHIAHRDLKPENIMVTNEGVAKIIDYGFCKDMKRFMDVDPSGRPRIPKLRKQHSFLGTPGFLPFSYECNNDGYGRSTFCKNALISHDPIKGDVYALGFVFLDMLTQTKLAQSTYPHQERTGQIDTIYENSKRLQEWRESGRKDFTPVDLRSLGPRDGRKINALKALMNQMVHPDENRRPNLNSTFWNCQQVKQVQKFFPRFNKDDIENRNSGPGPWITENCQKVAEHISRISEK